MQTDNTQPDGAQAPPASHRKHHPTSPSTLQTREASPCWIPDPTRTSEAAERGTLQHDAADAEHIPDELTDEEAAAVAEVLAIVERRKTSEDHGPDVEVLKEQKWAVDDEQVVDADGDVWDGTTAGFADVVLVSPSKGFAEVIDWKFGKHAVEPARSNTQGMAYALGIVHAYRKRGIRISRVRVYFYSPHIKDETEHTFTEEDFPAMYLRIRAIVKKSVATQKAIAKDPTNLTHYRPSVPGCMFCGRLGECEAVWQFARQVSAKYRNLALSASDPNYFNIADPLVAQEAVGNADTMVEWGKQVRQRVTQFTLSRADGWTPEGYQLITTWPRRVVDTAAVESVAFDHGVPTDVISGAKKLPLTPLEKYISANAPRGEKAAAVDKFNEALDAAGATVKSTTPSISLRIKSRRNVEKTED